MKLLTFEEDGQLKAGVKTDHGVLHVEKTAALFNAEVPKEIKEMIKDNVRLIPLLESLIKKAVEENKEELFLEENDLIYGPAVPSPGKIICVGLNYKKHAEESNMPLPDYPILFNKYNNTIAATNEVITLPFNSKENDYEAELAIVIGKQAKNVTKDEALDYVFGYCNSNDLSSRDLQFRTHQWLLGKSCDGFCPIGPYIVTSNEVGNPNQLTIKATVNEEVRQNSNTSDMIFKCDEIVSYISEYMTLNPGDIILTGTPEGVAFGYPEDQRVYLKDGDQVTIEIEKLGKLTNIFKEDSQKIYESALDGKLINN
ncbi:2-keto-4-pentenoate hydratase/2-oxohepta-3-ene-1,7-dioic acid hydratase in catechol pathway [Cytobacillus horneckiae]|uniref:fumarylacetoacetate hydrolase family protein n=1 Tax=Cytobacillus horneckiae TaxID=549687 RepID=UPI0019CF7F22|nr:fumarylacetoacetate hydrolase family protein [Cytobacillus horneckiae]MBN6885136.1 fumarylacetoacetate hydrolase family protein [Cytobacillus horneckiae]MCM3179108.1 fumarylacetoacetate hydrolase family protein [Cytobacillus horneckiae]